jgi:thiol:disulfide interchange protein DsbC
VSIKIIKMAVAALSLVSSSAFAFGTGGAGCSGDCVSCHPIKKEDFVKMFKQIDPTAKVLDVQQAPVKGLFQLTMETPKSKGIVYMDYGKKHIISGNIIDVSSKVNLTAIKAEQVNSSTVKPERIPTKNALILGNPKGKKTLYVFTDPDCPYCSKLHPELKDLVRADKELRIALILTPLNSHPDAGWKSQAIITRSHKDMPGAMTMLEDNYSKKSWAKPGNQNMGPVTANVKYSKEIGVKLLPSIVLPNGKVIEGYKTKEELKTLLATKG